MLAFLADTISAYVINPVLLAFIAEEPLFHQQVDTKQRLRISFLFWGRVLLCMGVAVMLAQLGKRNQVWPGHPLFPSGHTTFAVSASACLVLQRGRAWIWFTSIFIALMAVCLIYRRWHTPDEVLGGIVLGTTVPCLLWRLTGGAFPEMRQVSD